MAELQLSEHETVIGRIDDHTPLGGQHYPFLRHLTDWAITTEVASGDSDSLRYRPEWANAAHSNETPKLVWVNGNDIKHLTTTQPGSLEDLLGIKISMKKGGFVASKRISRLMRPYFTSMFVKQSSLNITYLPQDSRRDKLWDGAGVVSRKLLKRLAAHVRKQPISQHLQRKLIHELTHGNRFEYTILTDKGQDKGHAIVSETMTEDFRLIEDTKGEVKATDGLAFIGIQPVHHQDQLRLDVQSLINQKDFWTVPQLLTRLQEHSTVFTTSLQNGDVDTAMQQLDGDISYRRD